MSVTFFLASNLLHLESNIYVGLLAYMRMHARQHLKLEVRHKNSHRPIHTHTYKTDRHTLQARTYIYARMYPHIYTHTHTRGCTFAHVYTQCRPRSEAVYCWLVGFVALRPKSTAMVIAGRSVHLTTLFPGQA